MRYLGALFMAAALLGAASAAYAGDRWIHIQVEDRSETDSHVDLQVPLALLTALMPAVESHVRSTGGVHLSGTSFDGVDLKTLWDGVKRAEDGELITVKDTDDAVRVSKKAGLVHVDVDEKGASGSKVRLRLPVPLVEAIVGGGAVDGDALVKALSSVPDGDLVTVDDEDSHVRIWLDGAPAKPGRTE